MVDLNPTISIITLNINRLNTPIKKQRLSEQIKNQNSCKCCLQEACCKYKVKESNT